MKARLLLLAGLLSTLSVSAHVATVLHKSESRYQQQDYKGCIKLLTRHMYTQTDWGSHTLSQAHLLLANAYVGIARDQKEPEALITAYHHLLGADAHATDPEVEAHISELKSFLALLLYNEGVKAYNQKNYLKADKYLRTTLRIQPKNSQVLLAMGYVGWKLHDPNLAYHYWIMIPQQTCSTLLLPQERQAFEQSCLLLSQWYQEQGQPDAATAMLETGHHILGYAPGVQGIAQQVGNAY